MIDEFYYESSHGDIVAFNSTSGILPNMSAFRDYAWNYRLSGAVVTEFSKEPREIPVDTLIWGLNHSEMISKRNECYKVFDRDISEKTPGKVFINGSYVRCYVIKTDNIKYLSQRHMKTKWTFLVLDSEWISEKMFLFRKQNGSDQGDSGKWPMHWAHHWRRRPAGSNVNIDHFRPSDFVMKAYGPAAELNVNIGGNVYRVEHSIPAGGYMIIDSRESTDPEMKIYICDAYGEITNCFNDRYVSADSNRVLEKISPGVNSVNYSKEYDVELTVFIDRGEPVWK